MAPLPNKWHHSTWKNTMSCNKVHFKWFYIWLQNTSFKTLLITINVYVRFVWFFFHQVYSKSFRPFRYQELCRYLPTFHTINKLKHVFSSTNRQSNIYFNRLPKLCNALPALNLNLSFNTIKTYVKQLFWKHFVSNFNSDDPHSLHFICTCSICSKTPRPPNFSSSS